VEPLLHQPEVLPQLEVLLLLKSQPLRKRRKKKVGCCPRWCGFCSHRLEKEESDEDMGFGLFD
jgi:hypothetical protein